MAWSSESQERIVDKRQGRLQERLDAAAALPVAAPVEVMAASSALALKTADELTEQKPERVLQPPKSKAQLDLEMRKRINESRVRDYQRLHAVSGCSLDSIEERLTHGDAIVNADGKVVGRRPVRLRDLTTLTGMVFDRKLAIEKRILGEDDEGAGGSVPKPVADLLERLELLAKQNPITGKVPGEYRNPVIDVTPEAGD